MRLLYLRKPDAEPNRRYAACINGGSRPRAAGQVSWFEGLRRTRSRILTNAWPATAHPGIAVHRNAVANKLSIALTQ